MDSFKERVIAEYNELLDKIAKLGEFTKTKEFAALDSDDKNLLVEQTEHMLGYRKVLGKRIDRFG